ncbi:LOW QUALITY PROTEIN: premnaspirodiene oxygenase-like [Punica granatum]|uniref:LOW QUALITY PROTEIN: premnaspirodiene oxygenase-like n=1 Tax=Punica granatum TaxID=22663 RepID=A0A6P8D0C2_PUNGR|nr:LOW QUALITY PROTEIN: premnaspirodiene oxygenase-like [Punica granatum]
MVQLPPPHVLFTFLIIFLFVALRKWKKKHNIKKETASELPPGPKRLPLIGKLHQMSGSLPHHALRDLAKRHGPIMRLQLGEILTIVISSPDAVKEILKTHELAFAQRPEITALEVMSYENSSFVFAPYGEYWRQMRKICVLELLSMKRVMSFRSIREHEAWKMIKAIGDFDGKPFNLSKLILSLINDVTSRAAFGERCKYQEEFISFLKEGTQLGGGFELPDLFPSIKLLRYTSRLKPAWERLHCKIDVILNHIIEEHKAKLETAIDDENKPPAREDLVDVLLNLQKTSELKFLITMDVIKNVIMEIFSAGTDTSSTTIEWAMSEMLRNPRVMQKAQQEVRNHLNGKPRVEESDLVSLEYLKVVVKETLRLHPPGPLMAREAREKCKVMGYDIPSKTKIIINTWAIGRDSDAWSSPEQFQPERFLESSVDFRGKSFEYIPFGGGRRICPGINFGIANIELPLAQLLYHFDWDFGDGKRSPEELDMEETFGITSRRKNPLVMIANTRVMFSNDGAVLA